MVGVSDPVPGVVYPPADRLRSYIEAGALQEKTLVEALRESFARNAPRVALACSDGPLTFAQLDERSDRIAAGLLGLGLQPLDRVLFQSPNSKQLALALVACFKAGLIPVCTLAAHREHEIHFLGAHVDARAHFVDGADSKFDLVEFAIRSQARIPTVRHVISLSGAPRAGTVSLSDLEGSQDACAAKRVIDAISRDPFQVAIFQLSGGTTGTPKVIPRMQNDYLLNAQLTVEVMGFNSADVLFMPMQIIHNAAMICFLLPSLLAGSAFIISDDLSIEAWGRSFTRYPPTVVGMIRPLMPRLDAMLERGLGSIDKVRTFWSPDSARAIRQKYGRRTVPMFGMSEGLNMYCRADDPEEACDSTVGTPLSPLDEVRLVEIGGEREVAVGEIGELTCRGPYTISGYYNAPERNAVAFTRDGFYRTGDLLVQKQIDGRLYYAFAGRTKDVVDRGSEKVSCEEVEHIVTTHPAVAACAVVGMPDPVMGERICAYLVLTTGEPKPSVAELGRHLEARGMAKFKWPERVEVIAELPLTKSGKLDKGALRDAIRSTLASEASTTPSTALIN